MFIVLIAEEKLFGKVAVKAMDKNADLTCPFCGKNWFFAFYHYGWFGRYRILLECKNCKATGVLKCKSKEGNGENDEWLELKMEPGEK